MYRERMPMQLLAYLRLSRLTDPALLAKACNPAHPASSTCKGLQHALRPWQDQVKRAGACKTTPWQLQLAEASAAADLSGCHAGDI